MSPHPEEFLALGSNGIRPHVFGGEENRGNEHVWCFDQANLSRMNATKPISASASVKATPRNIVVRTMPAASG